MHSSAHNSTDSRDVLGPSGLHVFVNGTDFTLPDNDSILVLLGHLTKHTLDPMFEDYGNFYETCRAASESGFDPEKREYTYIDLGPIYEDAPEAVRFLGNFIDVDHPFKLDTNDPQLIAVLLREIRKNQESDAYCIAREAMKRATSSTRQ